MASANIRDSEVYGLLDLSDSEVSDFIPDSDEDWKDKEDEPTNPYKVCTHLDLRD